MKWLQCADRPNCGRLFIADERRAKFCPYCGERVADPDAEVLP